MTRLALCSLLLVHGVALSTQAQVLYTEDFEGLTLLDSALASDDDNETDYSETGPAGWTTDDRGTPTCPITPFDPVGCPEYAGWTFMDQTFWLNEQGSQAGRIDFLPELNPNNTVALVDGDAHDDFINIDPDLFSSVMSSPAISLSGVSANSLSVSFDSSWVPEGDQTVEFNVVIDGNRTNIFRWESDDASPNFKPAATNERLTYFIDNPAGANSAVFEWDMVQSGNNWWWAVDNIEVASEASVSVVVDRDTGEITFLADDSLPFDIQGYSIRSAAGALNSDNWDSIAETADANSGGSFDPNSEWVRFTAQGARGDLSEGVLGTSTIAGGESHSFGADVWVPYFDEDLVFQIIDGNGVVTEAPLTFVGNGDQPYVFGDINFDNAINEQDWLTFLTGLGGEFDDLSVAESYAFGDLNGDAETNHADFVIFESAYDAVNGSGSFQSMLASIPEPSSHMLLLAAAACLCHLRRR